MSQSIRGFDDFWGYYVLAHRSFLTQLFHAMGTIGCLLFLALCIAAGTLLAPAYLLLLLLAPLVGYGPAWISHFLIEKNKPVALNYPLYSLLADFKMVVYFLAGRMPAEVARFAHSA